MPIATTVPPATAGIPRMEAISGKDSPTVGAISWSVQSTTPVSARMVAISPEPNPPTTSPSAKAGAGAPNMPVVAEVAR